jgi:60 kDa SS-A/Ro ribonucleoprotein
VALYWRDGKQPLSSQVKKGLAMAFDKFDAYQLAKYNRHNEIKLKDVMFLVHPRPPQGKEELYRQLANDTLPVPDTWEVALSTSQGDKKERWERLLREKRLGALAFVRNLRNMEQVGVNRTLISETFATLNPRWLLPINYLSAAQVAPRWERELEDLMLRGLAQAPKLPGHTILVIDVSGSMMANISSKSHLTRLGVAGAMAMLAASMCDSLSIYATAGDDWSRTHQTALVPNRRGFGLVKVIEEQEHNLGGGGIFTRQCLEYIEEQEHNLIPDRIIIFSDSQDCDHPNLRVPKPFGTHNYIVDVSAHTRGVAYKGLWTAEVSGWSEYFLSFIVGLEGGIVT